MITNHRHHQRMEGMYNAYDVSDIQSTLLKNVHFLSTVRRHNFSPFNTSASQDVSFVNYVLTFCNVYFNMKNSVHKIGWFVS